MNHTPRPPGPVGARDTWTSLLETKNLPNSPLKLKSPATIQFTNHIPKAYSYIILLTHTKNPGITMSKQTYSHRQTYKHYTYTHSYTHIHIHIYTHSYTHIHIHPYTHSYTNTYTHSSTNTYTYTYIHKTHKHTLLRNITCFFNFSISLIHCKYIPGHNTFHILLLASQSISYDVYWHMEEFGASCRATYPYHTIQLKIYIFWI